MYCPRCGAEYRQGFVECADCHVALVSEPPEGASRQSPVDVDLETVFETTNPALVALARSLLEGAGIDYTQTGEAPYSVLPVLPVRIEVDRERSEEARALLADLESVAAGDELDGDDDDDDDPDGNDIDDEENATGE